MSRKYQRKRMKNSKYIIVLIIFCAIIFGIFGYFCGRTPVEVVKTDTVTKTDTFWKDTTIYEKEFVPKIVIKTKVDTVYDENGDTIELVTESKKYEKSLISGKDTADLKVYVTGIKPSLDSLEMRLKTHTEVNTVEITKYLQKKKTFKDRFHLGLQVGYGLGLQSRKFDSYVGFGVSFDL